MKAIPTLTAKGFVTSMVDMMSLAMNYFFVSRYSQSTLYRGSVASLPYIIQQGSGDEIAIRSVMEEELNKYLRRIFDAASVSVTTTDTGTGISVNITGTVTNNNVTENYAYLVKTSSNRVLSIINVLNPP